MTILITGGAGFIGSALAKKLVAMGYEIIIVDNFNSYYNPKLKKDRLKYLLNNYKYKLYSIDIRDYEGLKRIFTENDIDIIVHLAAQAGVRYSLTHPFAYHETNIGGTLNMLELAKDFKVPRFIYASSSSVYGGNTKTPFSEKDPVDNPLSLYAATKKATELLAVTYRNLYGMKVIGLRYFTVYGPWGRPDMAMFLFTDAIVKGEPINVHNQGKMTRNFSYIDDIVDGTVKAIERDFDQEIINLAANRVVELEYYIELIEKNLGKKAIKNYLPMQKGEVQETLADLEKAKKFLDYEPQWSVEDGVKSFIAWYKWYYKIG
ncbi:protein CapI [Candidatus Kuenenbacteria bacterium RIFCSPHIGHO2_02_FULL_39_13]|uniref:Protein CapI n=1 Tax=Candidatus Kuenenbacteria bacterium RIFCSPHIGHO2_02_FULL_39_13 TaxID=1798561 RepID=A0A1F6FMS6_9BACT|nr:MAG: protein CapI [Candidatus Kuenenbacteria bacterium RIFCSPHIGHO2_02_FULL_39_13]